MTAYPEDRTAGARQRQRIAMRVAVSRIALAWERLWPALWPAPAVVGLFLVLALFDVLPRLDGWLHLLVLIGFAVALVLSIVQGLRRFSWPDRAAGEHRLERDSGLLHRPIVALTDRPAIGTEDPAGETLWALHRRRMAASLSRLRIAMPRGGLAARDGLALRGLVLLLLVMAIVVAGNRGESRLMRALTPTLFTAAFSGPATLDIWITPPRYTRLAPIFVEHGTAQTALSVPAGSSLLAQVNGGAETPALNLDSQTTAFTPLAGNAYKIEAEIAYGHRLSVTQAGKELGAWDIALVPDQPPSVTIPRDPRPTLRLALQIDFDAQDDYGLATIVAELRRITATGLSDDRLELDIPVPAQAPRHARGTSFHDLTAHIWAGQEVELRLVASDELGQSGTSNVVRVRLPEREFKHPVSRAIIEQRRKLLESPERWHEIVRSLAGIASMHALYDEDTVVYLALTAARARLLHGQGAEGITEIRALLWDTALRIEDGDIPEAERAMRSAMEKLLDALANDAPDSEIERLLDQLQAALREFVDNMAQQSLGELDATTNDAAQQLQRQDLQRMLDQIRELSRAGARDAARQLLNRLQAMMENLRQGRIARAPLQQSREAMQMMRDLRDLIDRQQNLLDRTFRNVERPQDRPEGQRPGEQRPGSQQGDMPQAAEQDGLRRDLGEFMRRLGERLGSIPRPFGRAERAMRGAADALSRQNMQEAVPSESEALDHLQQGARSVAESLARQLGLFGPNGLDPNQQGQPRTDPLGRPLSGTGPLDTGDVAIPEEADLQRAREIRDELRRRSGQRNRPFLERDYIDRLLKRF